MKAEWILGCKYNERAWVVMCPLPCGKEKPLVDVKKGSSVGLGHQVLLTIWCFLKSGHFSCYSHVYLLIRTTYFQSAKVSSAPCASSWHAGFSRKPEPSLSGTVSLCSVHVSCHVQNLPEVGDTYPCHHGAFQGHY